MLRLCLHVPMAIPFLLFGIISADAVKVDQSEMAEAQRWFAAKFDGRIQAGTSPKAKPRLTAVPSEGKYDNE